MAIKRNGSSDVGWHAMLVRVPNDVYSVLVASSKSNRRSVSGEAVWLISNGLSNRGHDEAEADK